MTDFAANWKTYRNEKDSFEFKYPREWTLEEKNYESRSYEIILRKYYDDNKTRYDGMISMSITNLPDIVTGGGGPDSTSSEQINVDGQAAIRKIENWGAYSKENLSYKMNLKNNPELSISIRVYAYDGEHGYSFSTYNDFLDELMKTFKFTK